MSRFLVADDDAVIRGLVCMFLANRNDWQVCAEAADGVEAVDRARLHAPDIAILDIAMPRRNGLKAGREIVHECPGTRVLILSLYDPNLIIGQVKEAGIHGVVSKTSMGRELIPAIEALLNGDNYFI